ncbi:glutathione S-transferase family protein [Phreatobacter stygius]|uniref:Glutathione S-transferase family protein n=1 Tax=Phreatobacter stygius TaxID=1940610 RepID=A0A4D7AUV2_9HYPH|nr:glutathione S-transferase family protein [Phreatobacter stygius]QCI65494.1 glutathione S-transferase family protein [Phreatobacter stygius]
MNDTITLFHAPQTRSTGTRILLEELGAPYKLHVINRKVGEQRSQEYLAVNPLGKVPVIRHGEALVTEQVAINLYLADLFPKAGLAPALNDPARGPYLRWMVYYGSCYEPAVVDRVMKRDPGPPALSPYGDFDSMFEMLVKQLSVNAYVLGPDFSAADVLWGTALKWTTGYGLIPERPVITDYVNRVNARPAFEKVYGLDVELAAEHQVAADAAKAEQ